MRMKLRLNILSKVLRNVLSWIGIYWGELSIKLAVLPEK